MMMLMIWQWWWIIISLLQFYVLLSVSWELARFCHLTRELFCRSGAVMHIWQDALFDAIDDFNWLLFVYIGTRIFWADAALCIKCYGYVSLTPNYSRSESTCCYSVDIRIMMMMMMMMMMMCMREDCRCWTLALSTSSTTGTLSWLTSRRQWTSLRPFPLPHSPPRRPLWPFHSEAASPWLARQSVMSFQSKQRSAPAGLHRPRSVPPSQLFPSHNRRLSARPCRRRHGTLTTRRWHQPVLFRCLVRRCSVRQTPMMLDTTRSAWHRRQARLQQVLRPKYSSSLRRSTSPNTSPSCLQSTDDYSRHCELFIHQYQSHLVVACHAVSIALSVNHIGGDFKKIDVPKVSMSWHQHYVLIFCNTLACLDRKYNNNNVACCSIDGCMKHYFDKFRLA